MTVHVRVVSATREEVESDITITDRAGRPLAVFDGFTVQSLSASSRMSPERIDKGLLRNSMGRAPTRCVQTTRRERDTPARLVLAHSRRRLRRRRNPRRRTAPPRPPRPHGRAPTRRRADRDRRRLRAEPQHARADAPAAHTHLGSEGDLAGIVDCWPLDISARRRSRSGCADRRTSSSAFSRSCVSSKPSQSTTPSSPAST